MHVLAFVDSVKTKIACSYTHHKILWLWKLFAHVCQIHYVCKGLVLSLHFRHFKILLNNYGSRIKDDSEEQWYFCKLYFRSTHCKQHTKNTQWMQLLVWKSLDYVKLNIENISVVKQRWSVTLSKVPSVIEPTSLW